jgi:hypothetical protein
VLHDATKKKKKGGGKEANNGNWAGLMLKILLATGD